MKYSTPTFDVIAAKLTTSAVAGRRALFAVTTAVTIAFTPIASIAKTSEIESIRAEQLKPTVRQARTAEEILVKLQKRHYSKLIFDDTLSSQTLDAFIDSLDPGRLYFTAADIEQFENYRFTLDDETRRGNLQPGYKIFNTYRANAAQQLTRLISEIQEQVEEMDFSKDEYISLKPDTQPWAKDQQALDDRWRKQLKNSVLSLRLADKDTADIVTTLTKRYKNQRKQIIQLNTDDAFQMYMNALETQYDPHNNYFSPRRSENF
ncbi:hypothetical protein GYB62_01200 [bacterium]|nr:hypothetical protein [bacterium]